MDDESRAEVWGKRGVAFRTALIERAAQSYGDKPSDAQPLSAAEELRLWLLPTSPAAVEALKRGATPEEAHDANRLYAQWMKDQQTVMRGQGATDDQVHAAGLSDEKIFAATRAHAYERGKAASKNDPGLEADYHARMAERAARDREQQPEYRDLTAEQPDGEEAV